MFHVKWTSFNFKELVSEQRNRSKKIGTLETEPLIIHILKKAEKFKTVINIKDKLEDFHTQLESIKIFLHNFGVDRIFLN